MKFWENNWSFLVRDEMVAQFVSRSFRHQFGSGLLAGNYSNPNINVLKIICMLIEKLIKNFALKLIWKMQNMKLTLIKVVKN